MTHYHLVWLSEKGDKTYQYFGIFLNVFQAEARGREIAKGLFSARLMVQMCDKVCIEIRRET